MHNCRKAESLDNENLISNCEVKYICRGVYVSLTQRNLFYFIKKFKMHVIVKFRKKPFLCPVSGNELKNA